MKKNIKLIASTLFVLIGTIATAQQINYVSGFQTNINHTSCNVFNVSPLSVVNGRTHHPVSGGALRGTSAPVALRVVTGPNTTAPNAAGGVAFAFEYRLNKVSLTPVVLMCQEVLFQER